MRWLPWLFGALLWAISPFLPHMQDQKFDLQESPLAKSYFRDHQESIVILSSQTPVWPLAMDDAVKFSSHVAWRISMSGSSIFYCWVALLWARSHSASAIYEDTICSRWVCVKEHFQTTAWQLHATLRLNDKSVFSINFPSRTDTDVPPLQRERERSYATQLQVAKPP